jgi:hypothetical protein
MVGRSVQLGWLMFMWMALVIGCTKPSGGSAAGEEGQVRETVAAVQAALTSRDADKLWGLLDSESRADAEQAAKAVQAAYAKADANDKPEHEKALGLTGTELAELTGKGFLKTKRFHGKYEELSESKIDKVTVTGDKATVAYTEPDGDKEKLSLVREEGQWKVSLAIPKISHP